MGSAEKITLKTVLTEVTKRFNQIDDRFDRSEAKVDDRFEIVKQEFRLVRDDIGQIEARFDGVDSRLGQFGARFDGIDSRLDQFDMRLDGVDSRFDGIDSRFDGVDTRFTMIDASIVRLETKLEAKIDSRFGELRKDIADIKVELVGKIAPQDLRIQDHEVRIKKLEVPTN